MSELLKTPLHDLHVEMGAKMVPFAGYSMPVQYPAGVMKEHLHTRDQAGLFDVSHMGQVVLRGEGAAAALEQLVPVDILDLPVGKQRYAFFTNEQGGVLDDLMVANYGDFIYVVVNAACKEQDIAHMRACLGADVELEVLDDRALIALQGPLASQVLARIQPELKSMLFMDVRQVEIEGMSCLVSRSGYTGEDGYEISLPGDQAERFCRLLLQQPEVALIGLGARDSLRLESGLCLYGHDITTQTTPVEASLLWAISKVRRVDGERAGGFPGADRIFEQMRNSDELRQKRVGLIATGKAPVREGTELVNIEGVKIGEVTSGSFGPSVGSPVAMGYIAREYAALDTEVYALVRGKALPMKVASMPFVKQRYYRG